MRLLTILFIFAAAVQMRAGEWRLVGEARLGDGDWVPIESQSESVDTRIASKPQLLLPGRPGSASSPGAASLGGKISGDGWSHYIAIKDLEFNANAGWLDFAIADQTVGANPVWETSARAYPLEVDFTNHIYSVNLERDSFASSLGDSIHLRFSILRNVPEPELILPENAYQPIGWETFDLDFLPMPSVGKVYMQTKEGSGEWTTFLVKPVWFESGDVTRVVGSGSKQWQSVSLKTRTPLRLFRLYQVPFEPVVDTNFVHEVEVAGVQTQLEFLTFGDDCSTGVVRAKWTVPAGSGQIELGIRFSNGNFSTTRPMGVSPFVVNEVLGRSSVSNLVIYAKRP